MQEVEEYVPTNGFLDKNELREYLEEDEIFSLVLGYKPQEFQYICNPLRLDKTPGAYFETNPFTGRLELIDWGYSRGSHIDSFHFVQEYYKLPNFYQTLVFIRDNLLYSKPEIKKIDKEEQERKILEKKNRFQIYFRPRLFNAKIDGAIWQRWGISSQDLIEDKVFAVAEYAFKNAKNNGPFNCFTPTYVFTDFEDGRKKLYFPLKKDKKYITDCFSNDVGGLAYYNKESSKAVINKGYKDYRVFRNIGVNNMWFQSEQMFPNDDLLGALLENKTEVIVFFDNDKTGIERGKILVEHINNLFGHRIAYQYYLPIEMREQRNVKDPSDLREDFGPDKFSEFIFKEVCT